MMTISLTAIIPISNYEYHSENVERILQKVAEFGIEVILVLDDQPKEIFDYLRQKTTEMNIEARVIEVDSNNPGGARNSGMQLATRKWIAFWDCDDFPVIEEIIKLIEDAEMANAGTAVGSYEVEYVHTQKIVFQEINLSSPQVSIGLNPGIWRMIFLKEILSGIEFPELSMGEDQVFIQRVINQSSNFIFRNYIVYRYRMGVDNQLTSNFKRVMDIVLAHEIAVSEYNPLGNLRKITITMLIRQEFTILKNSGFLPKMQMHVIISLLKKLFLNPDILFQVLIYKYFSSRKKS